MKCYHRHSISVIPIIFPNPSPRNDASFYQKTAASMSPDPSTHIIHYGHPESELTFAELCRYNTSVCHSPQLIITDLYRHLTKWRTPAMIWGVAAGGAVSLFMSDVPIFQRDVLRHIPVVSLREGRLWGNPGCDVYGCIMDDRVYTNVGG
jgi:hypothetical protein